MAGIHDPHPLYEDKDNQTVKFLREVAGKLWHVAPIHSGMDQWHVEILREIASELEKKGIDVGPDLEEIEDGSCHREQSADRGGS